MLAVVRRGTVVRIADLAARENDEVRACERRRRRTEQGHDHLDGESVEDMEDLEALCRP